MNKMTPDIARTPQLVISDKLNLVPLSSLKPEAVLKYYLDNRDFHQDYAPTPPENYFTEEFWQQKIWRSLSDWQEDSAYRFMLTQKGEKTIIGNINLTQVFRGPFQNAILGYSMHKDFQGRGLMSEAVKSLTNFSFQKLKLHRIQAATLLDNIGSQKVLEKAKFKREGTAPNYLQINGAWRDHALFALINSDYK
jgi:ribosomal-protein-alanine N-acetyltransferase